VEAAQGESETANPTLKERGIREIVAKAPQEWADQAGALSHLVTF
jgi:hypothetical protein